MELRRDAWQWQGEVKLRPDWKRNGKAQHCFGIAWRGMEQSGKGEDMKCIVRNCLGHKNKLNKGGFFMRVKDDFYNAVIRILAWTACICDGIGLGHYAIGDEAFLGWLCLGAVAGLLAALMHEF